jgi:hypothetical protein
MVSECRRFVLYVVLRIFTKRLKKEDEFYGLDTIFYAAAFDANGGVLNLCWENKIVSFRIV